MKKITLLILLVLLIVSVSSPINVNANSNNMSLSLEDYVPGFFPFFLDNKNVNYVTLEHRDTLLYSQRRLGTVNKDLSITVRDKDKKLVYFLWSLDWNTFSDLTIIVTERNGEMFFDEAYFDNEMIRMTNLPKELIERSMRNFRSPEKEGYKILKPEWVEIKTTQYNPIAWELWVGEVKLLEVRTGENNNTIVTQDRTTALIPTDGLYVIKHAYEYAVFKVEKDGFLTFLELPRDRKWDQPIFYFVPNIHCYVGNMTSCITRNEETHYIEPIYFIDNQMYVQKPNEFP